jgi:hypothetical protein
MFSFSNAIIALVNALVAPVKTALPTVRRHQLYFGELPDVELQRQISICLDEMVQSVAPPSLLRRMWRSLPFTKVVETDDATLKAIAALCEAFRRAPADLGEYAGADTEVSLFPEQITAAVALLHRCVVQMDTGEGKTYAILPAAACLARRHRKVFIICANEYLAERDASRTQNFWRFVNLRASLFITGSSEEELDCDVVYTTLSALVFRVMREDTAWQEETHTASFGAVIVDEADAVLIDNAFQEFSVVTHLKSSAYDWPTAINIASVLVPNKDVVEDYGDMTAALTLACEDALRNFLKARGADVEQFLVLRHATELAYVATMMARKDTHYIVEHGRITYIDSKSGVRVPGLTPDWFVPLMVMLGQEPVMTVKMDKTWAVTLLSRFEHLCGLSGTIKDNNIEYLFSYGLKPVEVKPRKPRNGQIARDMVFRSKAEALNQVVDAALGHLSAGRPVLVGTQNINDAENLYNLITPKLGRSVATNLLTAKNDRDAAEYFSQAGRPGTVTIATQFAGRGVDIRLTDEARQRGGLALIGVGRNITARHDRQFLGRAGRQGDPFSAEFVLSLEDGLFRIFGSQRLEGMLVRLGLQEGEAIVHPWIDKALRTAQNKVLSRDWIGRWNGRFLSEIELEARERMMRWFFLIRTDAEGASSIRPPEALVKAAIDRFVEGNLGPYAGRKAISRDASEEIWSRFQDKLDHALPFRSHEIEGMRLETARDFIASKLAEALGSKIAVYEERRAAAWSHHNQLLEAWTKRAPAGIGSNAAAHGDAVESAEAANPAIPGVKALPIGYRYGYGGTDPAEGHAEQASDAGDFDSYYAERPVFPAEEEQAQRRTPMQSARLVLARAWSRYLDESRRKSATLSHRHLPILEYFRTLSEEMGKLFDRIEAELPGAVIDALLHSDKPQNLNNLYMWEEMTAPGPQPEQASVWRRIDDLRLRPDQFTDTSVGVPDLVTEFLDLKGSDLFREKRDRQASETLLREFIREFPITVLRTPQKTAEAVKSWQSQERQYTKSRQHWRRDVLRQFLIFLHAHRLIGEVPSFRHLAVAFWRRATSNLRQFRVIGMLLSLAASGAILWAMTGVRFTGKIDFDSEWLRLVDLMAFGGLLSNGSFIAPTIGSLILAGAILHVVFPRASAEDHLRYAGGTLGGGLVLALGLFMAIGYTSYFSTTRALLTIAFIIANVALYNILRAGIIFTNTQTGISILSGLVAYTSCIYLMTFSGSSGNSQLIGLTCIGLFILAALRNNLLHFSIRCRARETIDTASMEGRYFPVEIAVSPGSAIMTHALAAAICVSVNEIMVRYLDGLQSSLIAGLTYVIVFGAVCYWTISRRTNVSFWRTRLHETREELDEDEGIESILVRGRWRLLACDFGLTVFVLLLLAFCEYYFDLWPTGWMHRVTPLLVAGAVIFTETATSFFGQLYYFVLNMGVPPVDRFEYLVEPAVDEDEGIVNRLMKFCENRAVTLLGLAVVVAKLGEIFVETWHAVMKYLFSGAAH